MKKDLDFGTDESREASGKSRKSGFFSYVVCAIAAVIIWLVIMNLNGDKVPPETADRTRAAVSASEIV